MRLTLVIFSLSAGGAERVLSIMANYLAAEGWSITLLTLVDRSVPPFYPLDPRVTYIPLGSAGKSANGFDAIVNNLKRIVILRSTIIQSRPDVVVSFMDTANILTLLATRGLKIPVIVDEQNHPGMYSIGRAWEFLRNWTYPQAERVVAITARALDYFSPKIQARGCVIPNPAPVMPRENLGSEPLLVKPSLIAIGRLVHQKNFDLLLKAFASLQVRHPEWSLTILGEGELRSDLEGLRDRLGLHQRVHFPGTVKNPQAFLQQADIFVMSSRYEGFPNALCEAMACGLPVISTDCPSGPGEIIRHEIDGILVPNQDSDALAAALDRLMSSESERQRLAARAPEVTERFGLDRVMGQWKAVIETALPRKRSRNLQLPRYSPIDHLSQG